MSSLFDSSIEKSTERLGEASELLRNFAREDAPLLIEEISRITRVAPFRRLETRGGYQMSVAMTNCGRVGWVSDRTGYRYDPQDPQTGKLWPVMPQLFQKLAMLAADQVGFAGYDPDACLINHYVAGSSLGLHKDRDERDPWAPIVSVSLGVSAVFLWGGKRRSDPIRRIKVEHGDVVVWGGPDRFTYHGVSSLKPGWHPLTGNERINLTFRKVF